MSNKEYFDFLFTSILLSNSQKDKLKSLPFIKRKRQKKFQHTEYTNYNLINIYKFNYLSNNRDGFIQEKTNILWEKVNYLNTNKKTTVSNIPFQDIQDNENIESIILFETILLESFIFNPSIITDTILENSKFFIKTCANQKNMNNNIHYIIDDSKRISSFPSMDKSISEFKKRN